MREIKFRGKRVDNGEWVYGFYVKATSHWHEHGIHKDWIITSSTQNGGRFNVNGRHATIPETVGQFTGLTDKNGTEIFEGDIVKDKYGLIFEIAFSDNGYFIAINNDYWEFINDLDKIEVVGNIYDNKLQEYMNEVSLK